MTMDDYTFEQYEDARETRVWLERFLREHNGPHWRRKQRISIGDLLTGNFSPIDGVKVKVIWYRIKFRGVLIGYADAKIQPYFAGRKIISDLWIYPKYRNSGHFHRAFPALVEYTAAAGICIARRKHDLYKHWYEWYGIEWVTQLGADPSDGAGDALLFVVTRAAHKDMIRFKIKQTGDYPRSDTERGRALIDEVLRELDNERTNGCPSFPASDEGYP